ncbi:MAG TPA: TonB-dependent receptor [Thermoanaerobaculaceae bacterium]|nr:TonB-dependent receptor [Thermoanaerobaculaceae bacterium]
MRKWKVLSILTPMLVVLCAGMAFAGTTGILSGTVTDDAGGPLPGATVTVQSPSLIGGARVVVTGADGTFDLPALDPGYYTIKVELSGFVTQERTEVQVRLGRTTEIEVRLPKAKFGEAITVVAETPVVDPTQVSSSQTFTADYMKNSAIGAANRSYQSMLGQVAGVVQDNGNPHVFGSTLGENAYLVDGLDTTDVVTATFGTNFTFDAIQEINFETGGYEAEYGRATGGVVNLITKSGGNNFSGTLDVRYRETSFYQNGDHFNKDTNPVKFLDPAVTLGGPILRDKVWFFASVETPDSQNTPSNSPTTRKFKGTYYIGKATWQIDPNWRVVGKVSGDPADIDNVNAGPDYTPEATYFQRQGAKIYQAEMSSTPSPNFLWNAQVGFNRDQLDSYPQSGDLNTPGHSDVLTGLNYTNYTNAQYSNRNRDEYKTDLTWFKDNWGGSHAFKGGIVYDKTTFSTHSFTPGGWEFFDRGGNAYTSNGAYQAYQNTDPGTLSYPGELLSAYVQDAWDLAHNFSLKIGVRYDQSKFETDAGVALPTLDKVQPRLGFAWDLTNDAKTIVRGSWARFMHASALTLPNLAASRASTTYYRLSCSYYMGRYGLSSCNDVADLFGVAPDIVTDPVGWDPNGWLLYTTFGSSPSQIASNLRPTYADEWQIGFDREIFHRSSISIFYVDKKTKNIFEDTCNGNLPTPSADAACDFYVVANLGDSLLNRKYQGAILTFESRAKDWFHVLASYTYSKSQGSVEYTQNAGPDFDIYPSYYQNRYGYLSDDRRHRVKLNGYVLLPYDFTIGANAFWSSAFAWTPQSPGAYGSISYPQFDEPRGSRRANANYQLDLQVSKGFKIGPLKTSIIATILNVLNTERPTDVCEAVDGCTATDGTNSIQGAPIAWQQPRAFEAGFRIEF